MYPMMFPAEPSVELFINGTRIGLLQEYSVAEKTAVHVLRGYGSNEPAALQPGEAVYTVTLKRLLLDQLELPMQFSPYNLKNFTLSIQEQRRGLAFQGCQWTLIKESYSLGQTLFEELQLVAKSCSRTVIA